MKIAHLSATYPPYQAGTGNVCFHQARELTLRGHELHVYTAAFPSAPSYEGVNGLNVHRLRPWIQIGNAPILPQLFLILRDFDIFHLHYPFILSAEIISVVSQYRRIPLILTFHNDLIGVGARSKIFTLYQRLSARVTVMRASQLCVHTFDHYFSSQMHQMLPEEPSIPITELPNGVDTRRFHPVGIADIRRRFHVPDRAKLMLFVAALDRAHHFKGLTCLLEALSHLPDDFWLLVVGDGELKPGYQQQAKSLGVAERAIFTGAINNEDLPAFYRSVDVTVLPSSPPESFGLVLVESFACGTPVVASDIPGVRVVVDEGRDGFLVKPNDGSALAERLDMCLNLSQGERRSMGEAGRAKVEARYDWEVIGAQLDLIYRTVLSKVC